MTEAFVIEKRRPVGLLSVPAALFAPRSVFARVENITGYGGTLLVLLTGLALVGYATIETGLVDRAVAERSVKRQAELEKNFADVVQRSELIKALDEDRKQQEFERLMTRMVNVVAAPLKQLAAILLTAAALYGAVALGGRKPEWHTLMTICIFAGFADLLGSGLRLALMVQHSTLDVETSAKLLTRLMPASTPETVSTTTALGNVLSGIEPFRIWFWLVVLAGVTATSQLSKWRGRVCCFLLWLITTGVHVGTAFAASASNAPKGPV